jgi:hypothetical protein
MEFLSFPSLAMLARLAFLPTAKVWVLTVMQLVVANPGSVLYYSE